MKYLLMVTALIEIGAGVVLVVNPSWFVFLLLGSPLEISVSVALGRVAGVALCALAVANWLAHYDEQSKAARGVVSAMVLYNLGAVLILGSAGVWQHLVGVALWPAVVLHILIFIWCIISLSKSRTSE